MHSCICLCRIGCSSLLEGGAGTVSGILCVPAVAALPVVAAVMPGPFLGLTKRNFVAWRKLLAKYLVVENICSTFATQLRVAMYWTFSSAGLEHLPYKQRVGGSNPSTSTQK